MPQILGHKLDVNTIALWRLDETSAASQALDATGTYNLSGSGSPPPATGKIGGARQVSSSTIQRGFQSATITDGIWATAVSTGNWTVEGWFTIDPAITGISFPFGNLNGTMFRYASCPLTGAAFLVGMGSTGNWRVAVQTPAGGLALLTITGTGWSALSRAVFHHVAFRGTSTGGGNAIVDIFVDGAKAATSAQYSLPAVLNNGPMILGAENVTFDNFVGTMDDWRLSVVSRSDVEIADSYWRGVLDTTPQPWSPPYQETSSKDWQTYHHNISTTEALKPVGSAIQMGFGGLEDAFADQVRASIKSKILKSGFVTPDALAQLGVERQIPRGPFDSDLVYELRLWNAWNTWPFAGSAFGLLTALSEAGYPNVILAQSRGGRFFTFDNGGTNLLPWSTDLGNTSVWLASGGGLGSPAVVTHNAVVAPDGTTTAASIVLALNGGTTTTDVSQVSASFAGVLNQPYTSSVWLSSPSGNVTISMINASASDTLFTITPVWQRFPLTQLSSITGTRAFAIRLRGAVGGGTSDSATISAWLPGVVSGTFAPVDTPTFSVTKPTALAAGSLLTSTALNGLWSTDVLSSYSPPDQSFWSKFDVIFPLPLQAPSFSWSGGIPSSSSAEANFIRALIQAWKPAHATCNKIIIQQRGNLWGYPATNKWGAATGTWGNTSNTVWTP